MFLGLLLLISGASVWALSGSGKNLAPRYQHWLNVDVPYIIETDEREQFLALHNDAERDNYIVSFWESRNPTPGAASNSYKDEHYRRLAYANEHFGDPKNETGWHTDEGRIYITLGEPQSRVTYPSRQNVRPMIGWFYSSTTPALPPFFYILFYKRSAGDPYTLYSPYQDGPNRLVTGLESLNDQKRSLGILRKSLGDEVARLAITLIPSEPVDFSEYSPSMISDSLLATIRGLPDNYLQKRSIENNRHRERVTTSILTTNEVPTVRYMVSRDESGHSTVNYLIQLPEPDPTLIGERKDKTLGYDMTLQSHVATASGKAVYDEVDLLGGGVTASQAEAGRRKAFSAEERLPLAPGSYVIRSTLTNNLTLQAHRFSEKVYVPAANAVRLGMSEAVVYSGNPVHDGGDVLPFSFSNLRFSPRAMQSIMVHPGDSIPCVFQLWIPGKGNGSSSRKPILVHYAYASASLVGKPIAETDETVDTANADAGGNLVTGHTFQPGPLEPGNYRFIIRATQAGSEPVSATILVHVVPSTVPVGKWTAYGPPEPAQDGSKRALSAKAQSLQ